ncbi:hypothetical protein B0H13DRAFT_1859628 [Mycena leptocephala]|nr:hypothetical protein B0H13DRAFT_1859628 [Mycena leptocephala]
MDSGDEVDEWEDDNVRTGFVGERLKFGHTTGLFSRRVRWCECLDQEGFLTPHHVQLLQSCFYPATAERPTTAFTFNLLDEFLIMQNSGDDVSGEITQIDTIFPLSTPNFYPAFMRCSRQWRNLLNLRRAGIIYNSNGERHPGDTALFCVSCLQLGKNVSTEEFVVSTNPKLYRPQVVVDRNFKLDNLRMRNPQDDVRLADGEMFCVESAQYDTHVQITPEKKQRWTPQELVHVHVPVMAVSIPTLSLDSKWVRRRSILIMPFQRVFWQLPKEIKEFLLIYDISCQWVIHWISRFMNGKYLFFPKDVVLTPAVGKFHLGADILAYFWEFSLNFMEGTGQVDGEILETLWASLDKVVGSTRSMSHAHRQEVLDDYMNDWNWKKLVGADGSCKRGAGINTGGF